ncbi:MAG: MOSC domain-containing protein [Rhodanobacteraceae bacterium]|nr:MOSC domain-containing protein [Rhodanobacteraceae bacterium]
MPTILSSLHIYPVKSCAALSPASVRVERRGLADDRRWLVVDANGQFVTGRLYSRLPLVRATPLAQGLRLEAPEMPVLEIALPAADGQRRDVTIWHSTVSAACTDAAAAAWFSRFLGADLSLVYMDEAAQRSISPDYSQPGDEVSFADGYPQLLISSAALDALNARLSEPVSMLRFRPNLVVSGTEPHAEDSWKRLRIGSVEFDLVKPCVRCVFTTVDPLRGERNADGEPLKTLTAYRRTPKGVTFGQNLIPRGSGVISVGDPVEVLG